MRRVSVVGTTGSGKTIFARDLACALDAERIELDMLYWGPNWTERPIEIFMRETDAATARERWVADGNYSKVRPIVWRRADTLVWLDYPFPFVLFRLLRRIFYRSFAGEEILNGNYESLRIHFLSRQSLLVWAIKTHWKHRRDYLAELASPEYAHLRVLRLRWPREAPHLLDAVRREHTSPAHNG